jgi:hypothetical protein
VNIADGINPVTKLKCRIGEIVSRYTISVLRSSYVQVIRNGFLSLLALGALTLEGHAQNLVASLECDFPPASTDDWNMAASTLQYYIDTARGWRVNEDSFFFDGPANITVGGSDHVGSLSITISRQSGKATKTLSSEGKSLTVSGECKKMDSSGRKF